MAKKKPVSKVVMEAAEPWNMLEPPAEAVVLSMVHVLDSLSHCGGESCSGNARPKGGEVPHRHHPHRAKERLYATAARALNATLPTEIQIALDA